MERVRLLPDHSAYCLPTESLSELEEVSKGVAIKPRNRIEQIYSDEFAHSQWEGLRYRRAVSSFVRMGLPDVLYDIITHQLNACEPKEAVLLVEGWCCGAPGAKAQVSEILKAHGLAEQDIESEAVRRCLPDLIAGSQLIASAVSRRDKALAGAAFFREMEARQNQRIAKNDIANQQVVRIEQTAKKAG